MIINKKNQKGFTLIELVVYIAGLVMLSTVMALLIVQFYMLYKEIIAIPRADRTGLLVVDRITKEIRSADKIDTIQSQFGTTNGVLSLYKKNDDIDSTERFYIENSKIMNTTDDKTESITSTDFDVTNLNFISVQTPVSQGIKFTIELQFKTRKGLETKSYTGFALLRESYE